MAETTDVIGACHQKMQTNLSIIFLQFQDSPETAGIYWCCYIVATAFCIASCNILEEGGFGRG